MIMNASVYHDFPVDNNSIYFEPFTWETLNLTKCRLWMWSNWPWSLFASAVYIIFIYSGQVWMKNRPPFQLRKPLLAWNMGLALFSIAGFIRTFPEFFHVVGTYGFHDSICVRRHHNLATAFWVWLMVLSKIVELGDTAFIVLRKRPLIFLHWYHHMTVLLYSWATYGTYDSSARYFVTMNYFVHGIMYSYYALRVLHIKIPRNLAMVITALQISQMVVGTIVNFYSLSIKVIQGDNACDRDYPGIYAALSMYSTYFLLFTHFFYQAYFRKSKME